MGLRTSLALLFAAGCTAGLVAVGSAGAAETRTVAVGGGNFAVGADLLAFQPSTVRVAVGDTVTWSWEIGAPHTVTFLAGAEPPGLAVPVPSSAQDMMLNPALLAPTMGSNFDGSAMANSGFTERGPRDEAKTWSLTFTKPGTYSYVCLLHPFMQGQVTVEAAGAPIPSAAEVAEAGKAQAAALLSSAPSLIASGISSGTLGADGAKTWTVWNGTGPGMLSINRFLPNAVTVDAGDTVLWRWGHPAEPHTVTFLGGERPPPPFEPRITPGRPPMLILNPRAVAPSHPPTAPARHEGSGFINSGLMPLGPGPQPTFAVTFTKPGSYDYVCILHPGMAGTVNVREKGAWPPVVVDSTSWTDGDTIGFAYSARNAGSAPVSGLIVQAAVPQGTDVNESWMGTEDRHPGKNTGSEVQWFEPTVSLAPGQSRGPYVVVVNRPTDKGAHELSSIAMVSFLGGNAISARTAGAPPSPAAPPAQ